MIPITPNGEIPATGTNTTAQPTVSSARALSSVSYYAMNCSILVSFFNELPQGITPVQRVNNCGEFVRKIKDGTIDRKTLHAVCAFAALLIPFESMQRRFEREKEYRGVIEYIRTASNDIAVLITTFPVPSPPPLLLPTARSSMVSLPLINDIWQLISEGETVSATDADKKNMYMVNSTKNKEGLMLRARPEAN